MVNNTDLKVGINTLTPSKALEVEGDISASGGFFLQNSASIGSGSVHDQKGMFSVNYGDGSAMTGSLSNGDGYGEIVAFKPTKVGTAIGTVVFFSSIDWVAADKDDEDKTNSWLGVSLGAAGNTDVLIRGVVRLAAGGIADAGGDNGDPLYLGDDGAVTFAPSTTSGDFVRIVGYCIDEALDIIYFNPDSTWIEVA